MWVCIGHDSNKSGKFELQPRHIVIALLHEKLIMATRGKQRFSPGVDVTHIFTIGGPCGVCPEVSRNFLNVTSHPYNSKARILETVTVRFGFNDTTPTGNNRLCGVP